MDVSDFSHNHHTANSGLLLQRQISLAIGFKPTKFKFHQLSRYLVYSIQTQWRIEHGFNYPSDAGRRFAEEYTFKPDFDGYTEAGNPMDIADGYPTFTPPERTLPPTVEHEVPQYQKAGMHPSTVWFSQ